MNKEYDNYKAPDIGKTVIGLLFAIGIAGIIFALTSCNPVKKAYRDVAKYDAQTTEDSSNFYSRAKKMIKSPAPIVTPGKTIRVPYPVEKIKKVIDSAALQSIVDSLGIVHSEDINNTVDDCMASVVKARKEGVQAGYAKANYEYYIMGRDSITPEIHYVPDPSTISMLDDCEQKLRVAQSENIKLSAERDIYKGANSKKNWVLAGLLLALGGVAFFKIKSAIKPKNILDNVS